MRAVGFQDRPYYRDGSGGQDYLGSPASILSMSVPFGTWFGVRIRLHFWMLLTLLFAAVVLGGLFGIFTLVSYLAGPVGG